MRALSEYARKFYLKGADDVTGQAQEYIFNFFHRWRRMGKKPYLLDGNKGDKTSCLE